MAGENVAVDMLAGDRVAGEKVAVDMVAGEKVAVDMVAGDMAAGDTEGDRVGSDCAVSKKDGNCTRGQLYMYS